MIQGKVLSERLLNVIEFADVGVIELLKNQNLLGTVSIVKPFVKNVVFEFYANLVNEINDPKSPTFSKVFIRGHMFDFSPAVTNEFYESQREVVEFVANYDTIISELTANVRCKWPAAKSFPAAELSLKYSVLHKIT